MISTGNDIVALSSINKKRTSGFVFYSKILSLTEQSQYQSTFRSTIPFEHYVWLLWSVKESAYKYIKQVDPDIVFSPTKIEVQNLEFPADALLMVDEALHCSPASAQTALITGMVNFQSFKLAFRSVISSEWITSVVSENVNFARVYWGVEAINTDKAADQSTEVRKLVLSKLAEFVKGDLKFTKSTHGYPVLLQDEMETDVAISLAHHGHFVAYSFVL